MPFKIPSWLVKAGGAALIAGSSWWVGQVNGGMAEATILRRDTAVLTERVNQQQLQLDRIESKLDRLLLESKSRPWSWTR